MFNDIIDLSKYEEHTPEGFVDVRGYIKNNPNAIVYMFIGERNCGKSYSTVRLINDIVKQGYDFIYMRRYKEKELKVSKDKVFDGVEDCNIFCDGYNYYLKDGDIKRQCGYAVALTSLPKGVEFPNVLVVYFDEFTITDKSTRYIPGEFETFASFFETVVRRRTNVIFIFNGNARDFFSPYTLGWNISLSERQKKWTSENGCVKFFKVAVKGKSVSRETTLAAKLFSGTNYDKWANNEFSDNDMVNVKKKSGKCKYWCTIISQGKEFTAWIKGKEIYISNDKGEKRARYTLDKSNVNEMEILFQRQNNQIAMIRYSAQNGLLYYETQRIKSEFREILGVILRYA